MPVSITEIATSPLSHFGAAHCCVITVIHSWAMTRVFCGNRASKLITAGHDRNVMRCTDLEIDLCGRL
jgi:hypothetical protein